MLALQSHSPLSREGPSSIRAMNEAFVSALRQRHHVIRAAKERLTASEKGTPEQLQTAVSSSRYSCLPAKNSTSFEGKYNALVLMLEIP